MTLPKAIEILSLAAHGHAFTTGPDFWDALKMATEALTRQLNRDTLSYGGMVARLEGETERNNPNE
ncbi:hypothetical protein ES705_21979 [subsurface metagenome]